MSENALNLKYKREREQKRALQGLKTQHNPHRPLATRGTTSNGVRQVVKLEKLEGVSKTISVSDDELVVTLRLKHPGRKALQLIQLLKELDGWVWHDSA